MKHAGRASLIKLRPLLDKIRAHEGLVERKLGVFYRKSRSVLHFHEDPSGMFVDLRIGDAFQRLPVNTAHEQERFLAELARVLDSGG